MCAVEARSNNVFALRTASLALKGQATLAHCVSWGDINFVKSVV